jgi:hypothetical protein
MWLLIYVKEFWWRKLLEIIKLEDRKLNGKTKTACNGGREHNLNSSSVYAFHKLQFQNKCNISDKEGMRYQIL